jgi:hypothetical protein
MRLSTDKHDGWISRLDRASRQRRHLARPLSARRSHKGSHAARLEESLMVCCLHLSQAATSYNALLRVALEKSYSARS